MSVCFSGRAWQLPPVPDSPTLRLLLPIVILIQIWALFSVSRDQRFDRLSRTVFCLFIFFLPLLGFYAVHRVMAKELAAREASQPRLRSRLRPRL